MPGSGHRLQPSALPCSPSGLLEAFKPYPNPASTRFLPQGKKIGRISGQTPLTCGKGSEVKTDLPKKKCPLVTD
jgi:hypothetical protein